MSVITVARGIIALQAKALTDHELAKAIGSHIKTARHIRRSLGDLVEFRGYGKRNSHAGTGQLPARYGWKAAMIEIPLRINSLNTSLGHGHWATRAKAAKQHREAARWHLLAAKAKPVMPCTVQLTRIAPRALDDDNLAGGFKNFRDGVADYLGIADNDPRVSWAYAQRKGTPGQYAVEIQFQERQACS